MIDMVLCTMDKYNKFLSVLFHYDLFSDMWNRIEKAFYTVYDVDFAKLDRQAKSCFARRARVNKYVKHLASDYHYHSLVLLSLTFTDDVLASTSFDTRKKYVRDYCNRVFDDYCACVDYGKVHNREHYHAICVLPFVDITLKLRGSKAFIEFPDASLHWSYGFFSMRLIKDSVRSSRYAFKSAGYAFKNPNAKVFHKRGVVCFEPLIDDWFLLNDLSDDF